MGALAVPRVSVPSQKLRKLTISFAMSVRSPYGKTQLPLDRYLLNLYISKTCREYPNVIEIREE
jgi:hypothetical protein